MSEDITERAGLSRRRLLQLGAGGAALAALLGTLRLLGDQRLPPGEHALGLSPEGFLIGMALVEALFPEEQGFPSGLALGVHRRLDEEVWASPALVREEIESALTLVEHAPPLVGAWSRLSRLQPAERLRVFDALLRDRRRLVVSAAMSLKQMLHVIYYAHPSTWSGAGYAGPFVQTPRPPASSLRYAELLEAARRGSA